MIPDSIARRLFRVPALPNRRRPPCFWRISACLLFFSGAVQAQNVLYEEDFENGPPLTPVLRLPAYVGAAPNNATYTADPQWLTGCNGWVAAWEQSPTEPAPFAECNVNWNRIQQMAQAIGVFNGQTLVQARTNTAISAFTAGDPGPNHIEIQSSPLSLNLPSGGSGRFVTFGVDVATTSCGGGGNNPPLLQFYFLTAAGTETRVGPRVNGCTGSTTVSYERRGPVSANVAQVTHITAAGAVLYQGGDTLAIRMRNEQGSGAGNDHAFDNLVVLDVSPELSKTFATPALAGQPTQLTLTVTNTAELAQKQGWQFTDTMVPGLRIATPNNLTTTCTGSVIDAPAGGNVITVSNGNLPQGAASCTITVDVFAQDPGNYTNNAQNIDPSVAINVNNAGDTLEVVTNRITLSKVTRNGTGSYAIAGNNGIVAHTLTTTAVDTPVTGPESAMTGAEGSADTVITETLPGGGWELQAVTCTGLAAGTTPTFTAAGVATIPHAGFAAVAGGRDIQCLLDNVLPTDLAITKQNADPTGGRVVRGATTRYTLAVSNNGPGVSTGAIVRDTPGAGLTRAATNAVACAGPTGACPAGAPTVADLTGAAGLAMGTLAAGASASLRFDCVVQ